MKRRTSLILAILAGSLAAVLAGAFLYSHHLENGRAIANEEPHKTEIEIEHASNLNERNRPDTSQSASEAPSTNEPPGIHPVQVDLDLPFSELVERLENQWDRGHIDAGYKLSEIFKHCAIIAHGDHVARLRNTIATHEDPEVIQTAKAELSLLEKHESVCTDSGLPHKELVQHHYDWAFLSADAGHPDAMLSLVSSYPTEILLNDDRSDLDQTKLQQFDSRKKEYLKRLRDQCNPAGLETIGNQLAANSVFLSGAHSTEDVFFQATEGTDGEGSRLIQAFAHRLAANQIRGGGESAAVVRQTPPQASLTSQEELVAHSIARDMTSSCHDR